MRVIGERFGEGFQLLREVARGAFTHVYLASDGNDVKAVKLFPPEKRHRALQEYSLGQGLEHPNLNPIDALIEVAGYPGVLMPFVPGLRLGQFWAEQPSLTVLLDCFEAVLGALGYLHDQGIIHQDVKPENVLIDNQGRVRLIDLDLATRLGELHRRGGFKGTLLYLSPEQARGEAALPQSDLYALGVMLYRSLTGEFPFIGSVAEVARAHQRQPPLPPSQFGAELAPFDAPLSRLLAKEPSERFADAAEVTEALRACRAG